MNEHTKNIIDLIKNKKEVSIDLNGSLNKERNKLIKFLNANEEVLFIERKVTFKTSFLNFTTKYSRKGVYNWSWDNNSQNLEFNFNLKDIKYNLNKEHYGIF